MKQQTMLWLFAAWYFFVRKPSRIAGPPPLAKGGGGVSVTDSVPGGGRIAPPHGYTRDKGVNAVDQRTYGATNPATGKPWTTREMDAIRESNKHWASTATDMVDKSQGITDAETWHPGDDIVAPTPGRPVSPEYQAAYDAQQAAYDQQAQQQYGDGYGQGYDGGVLPPGFDDAGPFDNYYNDGYSDADYESYDEGYQDDSDDNIIPMIRPVVRDHR